MPTKPLLSMAADCLANQCKSSNLQVSVEKLICTSRCVLQRPICCDLQQRVNMRLKNAA